MFSNLFMTKMAILRRYPRILLHAHVVGRLKLLNDKWLSMNRKVAYKKILRCSNKDQVRNLGRSLDKCKWFNKTEEM